LHAKAAKHAAHLDALRFRAAAKFMGLSTRRFVQEWRTVARVRRVERRGRKCLEAFAAKRLEGGRAVTTVAWLSWIIATMNTKLAKVTREWKESLGHEKSWRTREFEVKAQFAEISEAYRRTIQARRHARRSASGSPEDSVASRIPSIEQKLFPSRGLEPRAREAVSTELSEATAAREDIQRSAPPREDLSESAWTWWQSRLSLAVDRERRALEARNAFTTQNVNSPSASGSRRSLSPKSPLSPIERSGITEETTEKHAVVHVYTAPGSPPRVEYER
jgi:hypothetical protein